LISFTSSFSPSLSQSLYLPFSLSLPPPLSLSLLPLTHLLLEREKNDLAFLGPVAATAGSGDFAFDFDFDLDLDLLDDLLDLLLDRLLLLRPLLPLKTPTKINHKQKQTNQQPTFSLENANDFFWKNASDFFSASVTDFDDVREIWIF
jgi:hypothetical protein